MGELEKQIKEIVTKSEVSERIVQLINVAGAEFPCLNCASRDDCGSFRWFSKWFGTGFASVQE